MTSKEEQALLLLAAKAIGKVLTFEVDEDSIGMPYMLNPDGGAHYWNPIRCSGDSRDLQVELRISLAPTRGGYWIAHYFDSSTQESWECGDANPSLAVLYVAAQIGDHM